MSQVRYEPAVDGAPTARQLVMREVNLEIFTVGSRLAGRNDRFSFICECADLDCDRAITLELHRFDPTMPAGSLLAHVPDGEREPLI